MKTIIHNGKSMHISAQEERAMRKVAKVGAAKRGDFVEGRGNYKRFILPSPKRMEDLGLVEVYKASANSTIARQFFTAEGKRCRSAIFANTRRLNALLAKLESVEVTQ